MDFATSSWVMTHVEQENRFFGWPWKGPIRVFIVNLCRLGGHWHLCLSSLVSWICFSEMPSAWIVVLILVVMPSVITIRSSVVTMSSAIIIIWTSIGIRIPEAPVWFCFVAISSLIGSIWHFSFCIQVNTGPCYMIGTIAMSILEIGKSLWRRGVGFRSYLNAWVGSTKIDFSKIVLHRYNRNWIQCDFSHTDWLNTDQILIWVSFWSGNDSEQAKFV